MKSILSRLARYVAPHKKQYVAVCAAGVTIAILEMIPPRLVGNVINLMSAGQATSKAVLSAAALWALVFVTLQLLSGGQTYLANAYGERILSKLRIDLFNHLQRLPVAYFERTHIGKILATHGSDVDSLRGTLTWGLNTLIANATLMILAAGMILITDWKLFLAVGWLAPTAMAMSYFHSDRIGRALREVRTHTTRVQADQAECIAGMRVVTAFNRQAHNLEQFGRLQEVNTQQSIRASALSGVLQPALQWIRFMGQAIILLYGAYRIAHGTLLPGNVVAVSLYWEWFMQPAANFGNLFNDLLVSRTGAERIFEFMDEPGMKDAPRASTISSVRGHVKFEDVSFGYHPERPVLRNVGFDASPGSTVAIVGPSGAGKTTLLSMLARFYEPQSGNVLIDDQDVRSIGVESLRDLISVVPQNCFLFSGTVMQNLRYSKSDATDEEVMEAAKTLGCHERFKALSNGYGTQVGERGMALSAGERQLICFTRALLSGAKILLLDEATSAIDPGSELYVQNALKKLTSRRTTFIVAHRLSTITQADQVLVMDQGEIVQRGTHHELMAVDGAYSQLQAYG